jgi:hypothetical protein
MREVGFWIWDSDPEKLVDPKWDPKERAKVIAYLKAGRIRNRYLGSAYCRMGCFGGNSDSRMGSLELTDNDWIWPEGFAHYLEVHQVKPPEIFVKWVLSHERPER